MVLKSDLFSQKERDNMKERLLNALYPVPVMHSIVEEYAYRLLQK